MFRSLRREVIQNRLTSVYPSVNWEPTGPLPCLSSSKSGPDAALCSPGAAWRKERWLEDRPFYLQVLIFIRLPSPRNGNSRAPLCRPRMCHWLLDAFAEDSSSWRPILPPFSLPFPSPQGLCSHLMTDRVSELCLVSPHCLTVIWSFVCFSLCFWVPCGQWVSTLPELGLGRARAGGINGASRLQEDLSRCPLCPVERGSVPGPSCMSPLATPIHPLSCLPPPPLQRGWGPMSQQSNFWEQEAKVEREPFPYPLSPTPPQTALLPPSTH